MKKLILVFSVLLCGLVVGMPDSDAGSRKTTPGKNVIKPAPKSPVITPKIDTTKKVTPTPYYKQVQGASGNWTMAAGQKAAVGKLLAQQPLTDGDRQQLSNLLFNGPEAGLTKEDERALSELMLDETARQTVSTTTPGADPVVEKTGPWFLRIYNNTGERLKVWVQVLPDTEIKIDGKETKVPPKQPATWVYDLETGKAYDLQQAGQRIKASSVHVWALSPTRNWVEHREQELHLTQPPNRSKTYMLTFSK